MISAIVSVPNQDEIHTDIKTPRPIAFISTIGPDGEKNVCLPSFYQIRVLI
jgi:flavin reductase (DIM6/NTAB) family NADH-FMN oxidoreductase RutF